MANLKSNVIANYIGQGWRAVIGLIFIPLYIHYLGIEAYGLIGFFTVMRSWIVLLDVGMSPTLNREMARYQAGFHNKQSIWDLLRSLEIVTGIIAIVVFSLLWMLSNFLANNWINTDTLNTRDVSISIELMSLVAALGLLESLYHSSLIGLQMQVWYNAAMVFFATLRSGGVLFILAYLSPTIYAFFVWQVIVSSLTVIVFRWKLKHVLPSPPSPPSFSKKVFQEISSFASGMLAIVCLRTLLSQTDKVILSKLLSLKAFGYYMLASTIANVLYMFTGPVYEAFFPKMVEVYTKKEDKKLAFLYHTGTQTANLLLIPSAMSLLFFGDGVLYMWSGKIELANQVGPILKILVLGTLLNNFMAIPYTIQFASGWTSLMAKSQLFAVIFFVPLLLILVPFYGPVGAAWVWFVLNVGYVMICIQIMHTKLLPKEKWNWYIYDLILPWISCTCILFLFWTFRPSSPGNRAYWTIFLILAGGTATIGSFVASNRLRQYCIDKLIDSKIQRFS